MGISNGLAGLLSAGGARENPKVPGWLSVLLQRRIRAMIGRQTVLDIAAGLPITETGAHFERTALKLRGGRIFATLAADGSNLNVRLTVEQQPVYVGSAPDALAPLDNAWGRQGWTRLNLAAADHDLVVAVLTAAWRNVAPRKLLADASGPSRS
jgi:hypothetical protein